MARGRTGQVIAWFKNTMSAEIAVLNRSPSRSSVTFLMHSCRAFINPLR
jgi:hypothetical protein